MKIKLIHKFFGSFLLTALMIVVLLLIALQVFVYRNFSKYVTRVELSKLSHLTAALETEYRTHRGWDCFHDRPRTWHRMVRAALPLDHRIDVPEGTPPPHGPPPIDALQIGFRLSLFDADLHPVAGNAESSRGHALREIRADGRTVGWLGLRMPDHFYHPLDIHYIKGQQGAVYLIAVAILALALVISFLLSKHLLDPVRQLTEGTQALAAFQFDTTLDVRTNDELGQLAADFNRMAETLKKYERMRAQWITDISHELRTPLSVLRGEIEAMQDGIREMSRTTLDSLHAEVLRLSRLVEDLHQLSLADTRDLHTQADPVQPLEILADIVELFRIRFDEAAIDLRLEIDPNPPVILSGDENRLAQLFVNLLENTLRYTEPPGTLRIQADTAADHLTLTFQDSPPGVPAGDLERIFDRLYRVDKSRSRELGGSGLGLSICRQIVAGHNGRMEAFPSSLGGLGIRIELPASAPPAQKEPNP